MIHPDDVVATLERFTQAMAQPGANIPGEFRFRHKDGSWRWLETIGTNLLDDPAVGGMVVNSRDVTDRKAFEARLTHLAFHDALTGLPNRVRFEEHLASALANPQRQVAVVFIDLDGFKAINDSLGHAVGDQLLGAAAARLAAAVRTDDIVARFGGDEFAVLLGSDGGVAGATRAARSFLATLESPFVIQGHEAVIRASIGIASSAPGLDTPSDLLRAADVALYRAKAVTKGSFTVFDPELDEPALGRMARELELRRALERGELRLAYQPIVDLPTRAMLGVEALVRWQHPTRGLLIPADFVPIAEETGLIVPIGRWVLGEACRQVRAWQRRTPREPPLRLYANLSGRELQQSRLSTGLAGILKRTGLDPHCLTLEITESAAIADAEGAMAILNELKRRGVRVAIDDFGTGYAALSSLKRFSIDELKIDASFVAGLATSQTDTAIVRAVVGVAKALGLGVTAEGVETAEQVAALRELGCDQGQGHFFAQPLPPEEFAAFLSQSGNGLKPGDAAW